MIEVRPSKEAEIPAQKALWKLAFGDEDCYIDDFYANCGTAENMLVLLEDGVLRSMLALLPVSLALPDGSSATSAYIYALATDPAARKLGFGRILLQYVDFYLGERGIECVTVVPADASLHKFFSANGFSECFSTRKIELPRSEVSAGPAAGSAAPVGPEEYGALRERLLSGTFHAVYCQRLLTYQQGICGMNGGNLYRVAVDGAEGCAVAERSDSDGVVIKELIIPDQHLFAALAVLADVIPAGHYHLRTPAFWSGLKTSYVQPFAMVKWFCGEKRRAWGEEKLAYLGLAFD